MDAAEAKDIVVFLSLKDFYNTSSDWPRGIDFDELVTAIVTMFRDHKALLGWYLSDEAPLAMIPMLAARQRLITSLDPRHITFYMEQQYNTKAADAFGELALNSIIGVDTYPWFNSSLSPDIGGEGRQQVVV